ncbi:uncharacterized protein LOC133841704 [Drosophila sulfurigaster albostrigata]|uniref:uncharacterized protein LOC133841704 n=1 Tax=Drosophila sulfurigaster albostrigata TaxID=89887 RepID=UPI002D21DB98|nr:uncharacterized protein LOC133841704 [Drosophila sulfurigaster albostrigata]
MGTQLTDVWKMTQPEKKQEVKRRYNLLMPIKSNIDPGVCRDTFLQKLFKEVDLPDYEKFPSELSSDSTSTPETIYTWPSRYSASMTLSGILNHQSTSQFRSVSSRHLLHPRPTLYGSSLLLSIVSGNTRLYEELLESLKRSSLYFMFSRAINRFRIMGRISVDWGQIDLHSLPYDLFGWSLDGYFKRCALPDSVYLDVLQMNYSEEMLNWVKLSVDIKEIVRYYKFFYTQTFLDRGYQRMMSAIWDQQQLINFGVELDKTLTSTKKAFESVIENSRKIANAWWGRHRAKVVKDCKKRHTEIQLRIPIEWRYVRDYFAALTKMQIQKDRQPIEALLKQRKDLEEEMQSNQQTTTQVAFVYAMIIENYGARLNISNTKLANDSAEWDNQNVSMRIQVNKVKDEQRMREEEIEFMQRRVKEVQELLSAQREALLDALIVPKVENPKRRAKKVQGNRRLQSFKRRGLKSTSIRSSSN